MAIHRNMVIKNSCSEVFQIGGKHDFYILGEFAKKGESNRNKIKLAEITDRQVSRRVEKLYENNFLKIVKETPFQGTEKRITIFGLTLKGLLASLRFVNVEDNYIIKEFLKKIDDESLMKLELNYIKNFLVYFFVHNSIRGMILDNIKNISAWFYDFETGTGISDEDKNKLDQLKKQKEISFQKVEEKLKRLFPKEEELQKQWIVMNSWHKSIEIFMEEKSLSKVVSKMKDTSLDVITKKKNLHIIDMDDNIEESPVHKGIRIVTSIEKYEKRY